MSGYNTHPKNGAYYTTASDRQKRADERQRQYDQAQAAQAAQSAQTIQAAQIAQADQAAQADQSAQATQMTPNTPESSMTPSEVYHMMFIPECTPEPDPEHQVPNIWISDQEVYYQELSILEPDIIDQI